MAGQRSVTREHVRRMLERVGIIPAVRVPDPEQAHFAAECVNRAGIPIAEITMTVPGAIDVISCLARGRPDMIIGAGTVLDVDTAERCLAAGAKFLTSPGLVLEVVEFAVKEEVVVFPGVLTPTDVIAAWKAGVDVVKVFPCAQVGGPGYIRALRTPFPQISFVASGGVNQLTACNFILAGAAALGIGGELMPREALEQRRESHIHELARRFLGMVKEARAQMQNA